MISFIISRIQDTNRRLEMIRQSSKFEWPIIFYNAICPRDINGWKLKINHNEFNRSFNRNIKPGEIGIWESNIDILTNFITNYKSERYVCVFEDDAKILKSYRTVLDEIAGFNFDCLMHDFRYGNFQREEGVYFDRLRPSWICSNAYIMNKNLARYIVSYYTKHGISEPWDHIFPKLLMEFNFLAFKEGNEWATLNFEKNFGSSIS